jgi:hypothetical protein
MKNYSTALFNGLTLHQVTIIINKAFRDKFQGLTIRNADKSISITITRASRKKARSVADKQTAVVLLDILHVLKVSKYNNWGPLKEKHKKQFPTAVGFLNFKYKCRIDGTPKSFRVSVVQTKTLEYNFQYSLHEDIKKEEK